MTNEAPKTPLGEKLLAIRNRAIANGMQLKTEEEIMTNAKMANEAPTPDEVEKAKAQLYWVNKMDFSGDRVPPDVVAVGTLLAHIAELEAENKRLSEELDTYRRNDKSGVYSTRSKDED